MHIRSNSYVVCKQLEQTSGWQDIQVTALDSEMDQFFLAAIFAVGDLKGKGGCTDFGNLKQGFLIMKLIQISNFRVPDTFFFNNCLEKNQNKTQL